MTDLNEQLFVSTIIGATWKNSGRDRKILRFAEVFKLDKIQAEIKLNEVDAGKEIIVTRKELIKLGQYRIWFKHIKNLKQKGNEETIQKLSMEHADRIKKSITWYDSLSDLDKENVHNYCLYVLQKI